MGFLAHTEAVEGHSPALWILYREDSWRLRKKPCIEGKLGRRKETFVYVQGETCCWSADSPGTVEACAGLGWEDLGDIGHVEVGVGILIYSDSLS